MPTGIKVNQLYLCFLFMEAVFYMFQQRTKLRLFIGKATFNYCFLLILSVFCKRSNLFYFDPLAGSVKLQVCLVSLLEKCKIN